MENIDPHVKMFYGVPAAVARPAEDFELAQLPGGMNRAVRRSLGIHSVKDVLEATAGNTVEATHLIAGAIDRVAGHNQDQNRFRHDVADWARPAETGYVPG